MELTRSLSSMRKIMTRRRRRIGYGWAIIINVLSRWSIVKNIELHVFSSKRCLKIEMELTRSLSSMRKIMTGKKRRRIGEIMKTMILILSIGCFFDTYARRLPWSFIGRFSCPVSYCVRKEEKNQLFEAYKPCINVQRLNTKVVIVALDIYSQQVSLPFSMAMSPSPS